MADIKKYYYMRLKENFFETDEMIYLEGQEEGYLFSNILLKLYLRSLKNEGVLMMNEYVPYDAKMIARFTNHSLSTVEKALFEFKKLGLIDVLDSGQMYMSNIELFVGKTTTEADRKRLGRKKAEQKLLGKTDVGQMSDKCPPEIELEIEIEKELDNTLVPNGVAEVEKHLKTLPNLPGFRSLTTKRKSAINARLNEYGYETVIEMLDKVNETQFFIENKSSNWYTIDWVFNPNNFIKIVEGKYFKVAEYRTAHKTNKINDDIYSRLEI